MNEVDSSESSEVSFSELILGFASAALYHMVTSPIEGKLAGEQDLALAGQNIGIVRMLSIKTKGQLNAEERKLIDEVLADLDRKCRNASNK